MTNKMLIRLASAVLTATVLLTSCSIDNLTIAKRRYNDGFYVHKSGAKTNVDQSSQSVTTENKIETATPEVVVVENNPVVTQSGDNATLPVVTFSSEKTTQAVPSQTAGVIVISSDDEQGSKIEERKTTISQATVASEPKASKGGDVPVWVLYLLAFFIPFVAVGLVTDWDVGQVLLNLLLCLLCGIPGIIHAFIVVARET